MTYLPVAKKKITEFHPINKINTAVIFERYPDGIPIVLKKAYEEIEQHLPDEYQGGAVEAIYTGTGFENKTNNGFKQDPAGDWYLYKIWTYPNYLPLFVDIHKKSGVIVSPQYCDFPQFKLIGKKKYISHCHGVGDRVVCNWRLVKKNEP
jgi:hypothetical protein